MDLQHWPPKYWWIIKFKFGSNKLCLSPLLGHTPTGLLLVVSHETIFQSYGVDVQKIFWSTVPFVSIWHLDWLKNRSSPPQVSARAPKPWFPSCNTIMLIVSYHPFSLVYDAPPQLMASTLAYQAYCAIHSQHDASCPCPSVSNGSLFNP